MIKRTAHKLQKKKSLKKKSHFAQEQRWAYLFVAPQFIGMLCFILVPTVYTFILCFAEWDFIEPIRFVGLDNFKAIFADGRLIKTLGNTSIFWIGTVVLCISSALILALLANNNLKGLAFFKASFFLPMATASVAVVLMWYWIYAPEIGIVNYLLSLVGIEGPGWLIDPVWSKVAIIIMFSWKNIGYYFIIFLAGLKGIPRVYYEAAEIDGANSWQRFTRITMPLLSTTTFFIMITLTILVLNIFDEPMVLTSGGPGYSTYSVVMYLYDLAFRYFRMGQAAVVSIVLFVSVGIISFIQFQISKRWVHAND